jgi:AcrR family transcriptional regulator
VTASKAKAAAPEPGKRDKALRQRTLIDAATAVFAEHGYDAGTTREVAERAGCSEGLIHRYFGGKRGLLLAIMESKVAEAVQAAWCTLPDCDSVQGELEQLLSLHLAVMWERRDFMRVAVSRAIIDPELGRRIGDGINTQRVSLIMERLRRLQQAGCLRDDVDLEVVAQAIAGLGFTFGFVDQVAFGMDRDYVKQLSTGIARVLTRGVRERPPSCQHENPSLLEGNS